MRQTDRQKSRGAGGIFRALSWREFFSSWRELGSHQQGRHIRLMPRPRTNDPLGVSDTADNGA